MRPTPRRARPIGAAAPPMPRGATTWRSNGTAPAPRTCRPSTASSRRTSSAAMRRPGRSPSRAPRRRNGRGSTASSWCGRPCCSSRQAIANARIFFTRLADDATRIVDFAMLAAFAERHGRVDLAILAARRAMEAGTPLMIHGYPIVALPPGGTIEPALIYAIVRQESAFDQYAISRAGARGLMQLMPGTAATVARRLQMRFAADRLTADGVYNLELGSAYLATLIDDFNGSYALAIASYNAGPGRVRQWLRDNGDPRGHDGAMVDWIESIPIAETRLYVQRVLESLQVYRGQNHSQTAFSLAGDLAR